MFYVVVYWYSRNVYTLPCQLDVCFQDEDEGYNAGDEYVVQTEIPPASEAGEEPEETPGSDYDATVEEGAYDNHEEVEEEEEEYSEGEPAVDEEEYSYVYETERKEEEGDEATADYNTDEAYNER